jgi:hypothetical protein
MMNARMCSALLIAALAVGPATACGDDDDSAGSAGDGAAGSGGTGGATNSGSSNGTGGSGSTGSGSGGSGTMAMNPADCPTQAPADNSACTAAMECTYGTMACTCEAGRDAGASEWNCRRGGVVCPATEPATGSACTPSRGDCTFGAKTCDCLNDSSTWVCWDPATDCPTTQPAEQSACPVVGIQCDLEGQGQGRRGNDCECTENGWDCGGQFCPAAQPTAAAACEGGRGVCTYGADMVCDCDSSIWVCWNPADCPVSPPASDSACTSNGMICEYDAGTCECEDAGWQCDISDTDGGV